jgi:pseudouridine-5'-phosphate glycosidase
MESVIRDSLEAAKKANIKGKDTTPFLLRHISEHTSGESLESNIALVRHNAVTGAKLAALYAEATKG